MAIALRRFATLKTREAGLSIRKVKRSGQARDLEILFGSWRLTFIVKLVQARIHHSPYNIGELLGHL